MPNQKEVVLVLHHTYFHDTFRAYPDFTSERFEEIKDCRFVMRFVIEKKTDNPSLDVAICSKAGWDNFLQKFNESDKTAGAYRFVKILEKLIFILNTEDLSKLSLDEGVITIADKIYSTSSEYEPILVINKSARDNFVKKAEEFYKATLKERFTVIPFRTLTFEETKKFLEDKYPIICKMVKERIGSEPF
jgi:hypothetical protein